MGDLEKVIVYQQYAGYADLFKEFGAQDERPDLGDDEGPAHIVDEIWRRGPVNAALKSANGASVVLDLPTPSESDVDDDSLELYKAPRVVLGLSSALKKSSGTKFVELLATIWKHFDGHDDEMAEAVELVTKIRQEVRARAIAAA